MQLHALEPLLVGPDRRALAVAVFRAVATARFATVEGLLALHGPDGLTRDAIDVWHAAGLVHRGLVSMDPLADPSIEYLALSTRGARAFYDAAAARVEGLSTSRMARSSQKRAHDLSVGTFALAVLALERKGNIKLLGLETDPARFAASALVREPGRAPERVALQADAYVVTQGEHGPTGLLVEVDRGTVAVPTMAKKYAGYLAWKENRGPETDFGLRAMRVLTIVPDARRLRRLHDVAVDANHGKPSGFLLFACDTEVRVAEPERLLLPVAEALDPAHGRHASFF